MGSVLPKTVLVVGSGGREHAMAWKLARSPKLKRLIIVPGNDGMSSDWERWPMPIATRADFEAIAKRAASEKVDLAVIGPDNQLAEGIVDVFEAAKIPTFGPNAAAARIEASKAFAKEVMKRAGVPTAQFFLARSLGEARDWLKKADWKNGWVIKADGLAYGKGVQICSTLDEGLDALEILSALGTAANQIVIEERLTGEELSWFAFCADENCALLEPARDHKRIFDGDRGPNTGGMGAFSPVPGIPAGFSERVRNEVFLPTLREMKRSGYPFKGVLYAGLMADFTRGRFWVLEFNCRFGDPETQVVLVRMEDDLLEWCDNVAHSRALAPNVRFNADSSVVVIASVKGYPESPEVGAPIEGVENLRAPDYFCAGVKKDAQGLKTGGGRVFGAMGIGATLEIARAQAYRKMEAVHFTAMHFRRDIGRRS